MSSPRALIAIDDYTTACAVSAVLSSLGFRIDSAPSLQEALRQLKTNDPEFVVCSDILCDGCGLDILLSIRDRRMRTRCIVFVDCTDDIPRHLDELIEFANSMKGYVVRDIESLMVFLDVKE